MFKYLLFVFVFFVAAAPAEEDCRLEILSSLPIQLDRSGRPVIEAAIGEHPLRLLVDTGSPVSVIEEATAEAIGEKIHLITGPVRIRMFGGEKLTQYIRVRNFKLGGIEVGKAQFAIASSRMPPGIDGLIGADFMHHFDVDFDFANAKLNFFKPHRCPGRAVYWTQDQSTIGIVPFFHEDDDTHILIPVKIDGERIKAILDTGAYGSVMNMEAAERLFDIGVETPGMRKLADGVYSYPFKTLSFENVTVTNPQIHLMPRDNTKFTNHGMLLGMTVLRQLHLFIAYKERKLYVTGASVH